VVDEHRAHDGWAPARGTARVAPQRAALVDPAQVRSWTSAVGCVCAERLLGAGARGCVRSACVDSPASACSPRARRRRPTPATAVTSTASAGAVAQCASAGCSAGAEPGSGRRCRRARIRPRGASSVRRAGRRPRPALARRGGRARGARGRARPVPAPSPPPGGARGAGAPRAARGALPNEGRRAHDDELRVVRAVAAEPPPSLLGSCCRWHERRSRETSSASTIERERERVPTPNAAAPAAETAGSAMGRSDEPLSR
jgi:hypothetical protein